MAEASPDRIVVAELNRCRRTLPNTEGGGGSVRVAALLSSLSLGGALYWCGDELWLRVSGLALLTASETLLLIATHEACHGTLLRGSRREKLLAAAISWPMAWPFFSYRLLHQLHHRWNGNDARDPERVNPLKATVRESSHPLWRAAGVEGGLGLILKTYRSALQLRVVRPQLNRTLLMDGAGVITIQAVIIGLCIRHGVLLQYLVSWLVVERISGGLLQVRGLVEHWGLAQQRGNPILDQLYSSRTIKVGALLNSLLGGLPYHSAHHAYPSVPSGQLPLLTERIEATLDEHHYPPLPCSSCYWSAIADLT